MKLGHKRLLKLADFLEKRVPSKRFNLNHFADWDFKPKKCGTTACALGWASVCFPKNIMTCGNGIRLINTNYEYYRDFGAAEHFFQLTYEESSFLFDPNEYPITKKYRMYVVNRIRQFVKRQQKCPR